MPNVDRVQSLLPADATGAFVAIQAAINQFQANAQDFTAVLTVVVIVAISVFLPFYLRLVVGTKDGRRVFFLVSTFVIWSLSITSEPHFQNLFDAANASNVEPFFMMVLRVVVLFWTFLVLPLAAAHVGQAAQPSPAAGAPAAPSEDPQH
jgi:hypothetical protein